MNSRYGVIMGAGLIAVLATALYAPFFGNPLVFDDRIFFLGRRFAEFATTPFSIELRMPAYFTIAFTQVVWQTIEAHRIVSLIFHVCSAWALYRLLLRLLDRSPVALVCAALFAIHPVAVYAAGYLVQRTIVLSTLFSLLSIFFFVRGMDRRSHADAFSAALMYSIAVMSKEHAIFLPAAVVLTMPLASADSRFKLRHAALYLLACVPAAILVVLRVKSLIGTPYEAAFETVAAQVQSGAGASPDGSPWLTSATMQTGLFFKYLLLWLAPSTQWMSIDMRVDFETTSSMLWMAAKGAAFCAYAAVGSLLLRRGGRLAVLGFGVLYPWVLFLVELSAVRFQEPFVLYRSYLWAPGIMVALGAALMYVPRRAIVALGVIAAPLLFFEAHDRLQTFSSTLALWEDAAQKLRPGMAGGYRTLFQLGGELVHAGKTDKALAVADRCIAEYPDTPECYLARGTILLQLERYADALPYLERTITLDPKSSIAHHHRGYALQELGERQAAIDEYDKAAKLGSGAAVYRLRLLKERPPS